MKSRIPQRIDYHRYTEQGVILDGVILLTDLNKELSRWTQNIIKSNSDVHYHLVFDIDILGNRFVTGTVNAEITLQCQRCMDNYSLIIDGQMAIAFVKNDFEQARAEESNYDIFWLTKKEFVDPRLLIEDELLLALPQIAVHPEDEIGQTCDVQVEFLEQEGMMSGNNFTDSNNKQSEQNDDNPFAILKQLKLNSKP
jgi:uncharacterized protein